MQFRAVPPAETLKQALCPDRQKNDGSQRQGETTSLSGIHRWRNAHLLPPRAILLRMPFELLRQNEAQ